MKIRTDFVTNSSSSSFVVFSASLSRKLRDKIKNHIGAAKLMSKGDSTKKFGFIAEVQAWKVHEEENGDLHLSTSMDNFRMDHFLDALGLVENEDYKYTG